MSPALIGGIGLAVVVLAVVLFIVNRVKVGGPNEAFIITGARVDKSDDLSGQKVVMGARVFVVPFVQRLAILDLTSRQLGVSVPAAISANGIRCGLEAVAVVKVGGTEEMIRAAAQRFLGQQNEIDSFTKEVLAGSLRAIVGRLTVESIIRDRGAFASAVAEEAETSLTNQGLVLDTFQLQDIQAEGSYLADLGRPEAARAQKEAAIAEAIARRESEQARILAEEEIAVATRELSLKQAEIKAQTDAASANAASAGPLAQAAKDEEVIIAQEKVAERRALLKERELDTEVRKPADASRYAIEQQAQAERSANILRAEAESESIKRLGDAEQARRQAAAEASKVEGMAEASAIQARGEAEAIAIRAKGEAEADAMDKKATAFQGYGEAAVIDIVAEALPQIVREAAAPMGNIGSMTVISTDGASQTVRSVASTVVQGQQLAKDVLGLDLGELVGAFIASRQGQARDEADVPVTATPGQPAIGE